MSSYAIDDGTRLVLVDPLAPPDELLEWDRERVVVLTAPWHERDAQSIGAGAASRSRRRCSSTASRTSTALQPLLELPIELVLPTHGEPTVRAALERALSPAPAGA